MIHKEIFLPVPREEVWEALTDPEHLEDWFANTVEVDLRPGGGASFRWGNGEERQATFTEVDPERRLAFDWDDDGAVEFTLDDDAGGTAPDRGGVVARLEHGTRAAGFGARRCLTHSTSSSALSPTRAGAR